MWRWEVAPDLFIPFDILPTFFPDALDEHVDVVVLCQCIGFYFYFLNILWTLDSTPNHTNMLH